MSTIDSEPSKGLPSRFVTHALTIAISGLVAWATSFIFEWQKDKRDEGRYVLERDKAKLEIVDLFKDKQPTLALALIDYYRDKFAKEDTSYASLLIAIETVISTVQVQIALPQPTDDAHKEIASLTSEFVKDQFFSAARRQYAEYIVDLYKKSGQDAQRIVSVLLNTIIPKDDDSLRRYRVNLYVALTFSLLPRGATTPDDLGRLKALAGYLEYHQNSTFKLNVDRAIAKQGASSAH